jgi:MOSC domain-containing protein
MSQLVGHIKEVWRYPVKSMVGEILDQAYIASYGLQGDRGWAVRDEDAGELTVVRKTPKLLHCKARYTQEPNGEEIPTAIIEFPDGSEVCSDDPQANQRISSLTKKHLSLWPLQPKRNWQHYRLAGVTGAKAMKRQFASKELPDMSSFSWKLLMELSFFATPLGRHYDCFPLHILTTNSLKKMAEIEPEGDFRAERFRPNLLIESATDVIGFDEFNWLDGTLSIGETIIKCESRTVRCSMPAQPQADIDKDSRVIRAVNNHTGRHLGINATVIQTGNIRCGDEVRWTPAQSSALRNAVKPAWGKLKTKMIHSSLKAIDFVARN